MRQVSRKFLTLFVIFFMQFILHGVNGENVYYQLEKLKPQQRRSLIEFKKLVMPMLTQEWMKEDIHLIRFLEFNRFSISKARDHLKEMLQWREENKIDEILNNPPDYLKEFEEEYPIFNDGYDKEGRPICEYWFGKWPIRKSALIGKVKHLSLYLLLNCFERASQKVREQQAAGKNVTQFVMLTNMEGFNLLDQACPACIPIALAITAGVEKYYLGQAYGFWLINTPDSFATLFRLLRPLLSSATRSAIEFLTSNELQWKPFIEKRIDFSEISDWYGGSKERNLFV